MALPLDNLGASIFPADTVTQVTTSVSTVITDNIAMIIGVAVFWGAIKLAVKMFGGVLKGGKLRV